MIHHFSLHIFQYLLHTRGHACMSGHHARNSFQNQHCYHFGVGLCCTSSHHHQSFGLMLESNAERRRSLRPPMTQPRRSKPKLDLDLVTGLPWERTDQRCPYESIFVSTLSLSLFFFVCFLLSKGSSRTLCFSSSLLESAPPRSIPLYFLLEFPEGRPPH